MKRITITIPDDVVDEADRRADELDRSRSWVVVEALRKFLASSDEASSAVGEQQAHRYEARGIGWSRKQQLLADVGLTIEERVREAERAALVAELVRRGRRRDQLIMFETFEDYLDWKRREDLGL